MARKRTHSLIEGLFGFRGRMRRRDYWLFSLLTGAIAIALWFAVGRVFGLAEDDPWMSVLSLVAVWPSAALMAKRLHDRDRSGWLAVIGCLPMVTPLLLLWFTDPRLQVADQVFALLVSLWMLVDLGILDGTKGPNRYGASPKGIGGPTDAELDEVFA